MQKLFMVFLGGKAKGALTEVHDVVFTIGTDIDDIKKSLKDKWFGEQKELHIDSYREITAVDGYAISLNNKSEQSQCLTETMSLYFIQMGWSVDGIFGELHSCELLVASCVEDAKLQAKQRFFNDKKMPHLDVNASVDSIIHLQVIDQYCISVSPSLSNADDADTIIHCYINL